MDVLDVDGDEGRGRGRGSVRSNEEARTRTPRARRRWWSAGGRTRPPRAETAAGAACRRWTRSRSSPASPAPSCAAAPRVRCAARSLPPPSPTHLGGGGGRGERACSRGQRCRNLTSGEPLARIARLPKRTAESKWSCLAVFSWWRPTGGAARLGVWTRPPALYSPLEGAEGGTSRFCSSSSVSHTVPTLHDSYRLAERWMNAGLALGRICLLKLVKHLFDRVARSRWMREGERRDGPRCPRARPP